MTDIQIISDVAVAVAMTAVVTFLLTSRKMRRKVAYMLDALEDKELNFRFDERRLAGRKFNRTLNRLRNIFDKERHEIIEQEKYFGMMLDHVRTGVAVIEKDGRVNYCNQTALTLLGIATFSHIRQLRQVSESLYNAFLTVTDDAEERASYYNESGKMTISLTASSALIGKTQVRVVAFNDISSEIAENEQESWSKLIRVLTHETLLKFDGVDDEVRNGLDTISQSSKGLIKFVDSYRNLTRIAPPVKKAFYFKELADRVMNLTNEQALLSGVQCTYTEKTDDIILYADEGQITQIMLNLVKNAIQADAKTVEITAEINLSEHIIINVFNDGSPISQKSQEEIFVPFFTTKQDGTGIGLSLSRQIMRMHNGTISLTRSDENGTIFTLIFR